MKRMLVSSTSRHATSLQSLIHQLNTNISFKALVGDIKSINIDELTHRVPENTEQGDSSQYKFNLKRYFNHLQTNTLGNIFLYKHELTSTQDIINKYSNLLPDGCICLSDLQTKAKGRGKNIWSSPPGCLTFTFKTLVSLKEGSLIPLLQYIACLSIVKAIKDLDNSIEVKIKWPNDIYVKKGEEIIKVGGILSQSTASSNGFSVVIGVGLNIDNNTPTTCINACGNSYLSREVVLAHIINRFEELKTQLDREGFDVIRNEYVRHWLHSNQIVTLENSNTPLTVTVETISLTTGALVAKDEKGNSYELYPDGNSFDFFNGLIHKKVTLR